MSFRAFLAVSLLVGGAVLAGCVSPAAVSPASVLPGGLDLLAAKDSLWPDHENEPHPGWNWPTLTHPGTGANVPDFWKPIPSTPVPAKITGLTHLAQVEGIPQGAGIAIFGSIALVPGEGKESYVVDLSNPEKPTLLASYPVPSAERGAAFMPFPDGRLYAIVASSGFDVVNLTDPKHPEVLSTVKPLRGGHKVGVVPGTPFVYNANSKGGDSDALFGTTSDVQQLAKGVTEIYDLSDPANPVLVQNFPNGYGCHHIFFWINAEKQRAICAGIEYTQIWDIKDPKAPKVIVSVPVHHGVAAAPSTAVAPIAFSHFSILNTKGDMLIVGDEMGGGSIPPGCTVPGAPTGAVWFYDIKNEKDPKLLGWFSPGTFLADQPENNPRASCTAHHGRLVPLPDGKEVLALSFYGAGVVLIDFSNPMLPQKLAQWDQGTNTWETWYDNGYIFTGDLQRGMDVLKLK